MKNSQRETLHYWWGKTIGVTADFSSETWRPEGRGTFPSVERKRIVKSISTKNTLQNEGKVFLRSRKTKRIFSLEHLL